MRKLLLMMVCIVAITIGVAGSHFTTAQETPATPGVPLMCATPVASPESSATAVTEMAGTPVTGIGETIASPGAMVGEECSAGP